jgi:hypothetical protein
LELCIPEPETVCSSPSGLDHLRCRINPKYLAFWANQVGYGQCWLSRARSNIQNCVPTGNQPILNKSMCDRRKHLPRNFAVLLPERRGVTPCAYSLLVWLHQEEYTQPTG